MRTALIVARARNGVIGRNGQLPWHLPGDLKYFKQATMGKPIIMGRKTWDSIGRPLPGRLNVVVTRDRSWPEPQGASVVYSLDDALTKARAHAELDGVDEVVVIGGAELYRLAMPEIDRMYITEVHAEVSGDTYFPDVELSDWQELGREDFTAADNNPYDYSFVVYQRAGAESGG